MMKKLSAVMMTTALVAFFAVSPFAANDGEKNGNRKVTQEEFQETVNFFQDQLDRSLPVGALIAWHKNFPGTPELPDGWTECNGQVLDDPESPYNGQMLPNLNGEGRFLRGSNASGTDEADTLASHDHDVNLTASTEGTHSHGAVTNIAEAGQHGHNASTSIAENGNHDHSANTSIGGGGAHLHPEAGNHKHSSGTDSIQYIPGAGPGTPIPIPPLSGTTGNAGAHTHPPVGDHTHSASTSIAVAGQHGHNASTSIAENGNHNHSASTSIAEAGSHNHAVNGKTAAEGDGETRPINMSVVWIMKVKMTYPQQ